MVSGLISSRLVCGRVDVRWVFIISHRYFYSCAHWRGWHGRRIAHAVGALHEGREHSV